MTESESVPDQAQAAIAAIGARARQTNLSRVDQLARLLGRSSIGADEARAAAAVAHQLAGSAGTFGWAEASRLARDLERRLGDRPPTTGEEAAPLVTVLECIGSALRVEPDAD